MATNTFKAPIDSTLIDSIRSDLDAYEFTQYVLNHILPNRASCLRYEILIKIIISSIGTTIYSSFYNIATKCGMLGHFGVGNIDHLSISWKLCDKSMIFLLKSFYAMKIDTMECIVCFVGSRGNLKVCCRFLVFETTCNLAFLNLLIVSSC